jgi:hypothetical protein
MTNMDTDEEFEEFDTPPEEILAVLDAGEPEPPRIRVTRSTLGYDSSSGNRAVKPLEQPELVPVG